MQSTRRARKKRTGRTPQGAMLLAYRIRAKLTQREAATLLCITPQYLCVLERGWDGDGQKTDPSVSVLRRIAKQYGCPIRKLVF